MRTILVAAAACLLGTSVASAADLKLGVVNVREILARYKKLEDLQKKSMGVFTKRREDLETRRRQLRDRVIEIQSKQIGENDPRRLRAVKQIETDEFLLKIDHRELQGDMKKMGDRITRHALDEISAACRRIGEAQGYFMIFKRLGADPNATDDREHVEAFQIDPLLYYSPDADITSAVLDLLEDAYRQGINLVPGDPLEN